MRFKCIRLDEGIKSIAQFQPLRPINEHIIALNALHELIDLLGAISLSASGFIRVIICRIQTEVKFQGIGNLIT